MDAMMAIGHSKRGKGERYVIQLKVRSTEQQYGPDNVMNFRIATKSVLSVRKAKVSERLKHSATLLGKFSKSREIMNAVSSMTNLNKRCSRVFTVFTPP